MKDRQGSLRSATARIHGLGLVMSRRMRRDRDMVLAVPRTRSEVHRLLGMKRVFHARNHILRRKRQGLRIRDAPSSARRGGSRIHDRENPYRDRPRKPEMKGGNHRQDFHSGLNTFRKGNVPEQSLRRNRLPPWPYAPRVIPQGIRREERNLPGQAETRREFERSGRFPVLRRELFEDAPETPMNPHDDARREFPFVENPVPIRIPKINQPSK